MEKNNHTYEVCPHCGEEVRLDAELKVQTCPNCGKRIVACSMCLAVESDKPYCTNCCLCYQAEQENQELDAYRDLAKRIHDLTIAMGEKDGDSFRFYLDLNGAVEIDHHGVMTDILCAHVGADDALTFLASDKGDDRQDFVSIYELPLQVVQEALRQMQAQEAEEPVKPLFTFTPELNLLGEALQDITICAWPIVWDENKYDQDSREVLPMLREWAVEFATWWLGLDEEEHYTRSYYEEVYDFAERKAREYVKDLLAR